VSRADAKVERQGVVLSVQPRILLMRSFDQRSHIYLGYVVRIRGTFDGEARDFGGAPGKGARQKHQLRAGDRISGKSHYVLDPRRRRPTATR
jgi:hypothetical protein